MKFGFSTVNFLVFKLLKQLKRPIICLIIRTFFVIITFQKSHSWKKLYLFIILEPIFVGFAILHFKRYENFIWLCSLFDTSPINFSSASMKFHNQYYHRALRPQFWWRIPYLKEKERKIKLLSWLQFFFNSCWCVLCMYASFINFYNLQFAILM